MRSFYMVPVIAILLIATAAHAADAADAAAAAAAATDGPDRAAIIASADESLAKITAMSGAFVQIAPNGSVSRGRYYLARPGRMRFEYELPDSLLVVADGSSVAIVDSSLGSFDRLPLSATPLGLLLDDQTSLASGSRIYDIHSSDHSHYLRIGDRDGTFDERMLLEFSRDSFALLGWTIRGADGGLTRISLSESTPQKSLPARLFRIEDPEDNKDRRR